MKTLVLFLTVLCSCFVFAYGIAAQEQQEQTSFTPYAASASASTDVFEVPASMQLSPGTKAAIEACLGEPVITVGDAVLLVHRTTLPDGHTVLVAHGNPQGAVMLGASSGETYRLAASDVGIQVIAPSDTFVVTFTANLWVIGRGGDPRFGGPILLHITVTSTGDIAANIEMIDKAFQCLP